MMAVWIGVTNLWSGNFSLRGALGDCRISYVYDGDTVALSCPGEDDSTARLQGFDTPETRDASCAAERTLGQQATTRLRQLIAGGTPSYYAVGRDKYGRELIQLFVDGEDVGDTLIEEGLAQPYTGGQRINWCRYLRTGG